MKIEQELYLWRYAKDTSVMLIFLWLACHADGYKACASLRKISSETGVSFQAVRTAIGKMERDGVITQQPTQQGTEITICKYVQLDTAKKQKATQKATRPAKDLSSFVLPEHRELWSRWLDYRRAIRKTFATTATAEANYRKLCEMAAVSIPGTSVKSVSIDRMNKIIDNTIANQYQGLVAPYDLNNTNTNNVEAARALAAQHDTEAAISTFDAAARIAALRAGREVSALPS